jgi:hypothetical protein
MSNDASYDSILVAKVYDRLKENALGREPFPWKIGKETSEVYDSIDHIAEEAIDNLNDSPGKGAGVIKKGNDYLVLSVIERDALNHSNLLKFVDPVIKKVNERISEGSSKTDYHY